MKTIRSAIFLIAMVGMLCAWLSAQDDSDKKPVHSRSVTNAQMPPSPQPAPEMTKLIKAMAGNWIVSEKVAPSTMFPTGATGKGTAKMWAGPGGLSLMESYHSSGAMGNNFSGFGTFWWDSKAQVYRGLWCDSMTPGGCDANGTTKWDGETLVGMMESDANGQKMVMKFTYTNWSPSSFVMDMTSGPDANSLKEFMTVTYTRAAGTGTPEMAKPAPQGQ